MEKIDPRKKLIRDEITRRTKSVRHLLKPHQQDFYDLIKTGVSDHYAIYSSRKLGKSYTLLLLAYEYCYNHTNHIVRIVLPNLKQGRDVILPISNELKDILPPDMLPRLYKSELTFEFSTGSRIIIGGAHPDNVESNRGPICHFLICDEVAAFHGPSYEYTLMSILLPQLTTTRGLRIDATTPPKSPDHPWIKETYPLLEAKGALKKYTIYDNTLLEPDQIQAIIERYGGVDNPNFKREYLAELIPDNSILLVPEFSVEEHTSETNIELVDNFGEPAIFWASTSMDVGLVDDTAIVGGYYNHYTDTLMINYEFMDNQLTLSEIAEEWSRAKVNYTSPSFVLADGPIDVFDVAGFTLRHEHGCKFRRPRKSKVEETINYLRNCFSHGKILINSKTCPGLVAQLKTAIWKDNHKDIERSDEHGHYDAVMALAYLCKEVPWGRGPSSSLTTGLKFSNFAKKPTRRKVTW